MAFERRNLSVIGFCNRFTSWHYKSLDAIATIIAPGYFAESKSGISAGDHFVVNARDGNAVLFAVQNNNVTVACVAFNPPEPQIKRVWILSMRAAPRAPRLYRAGSGNTKPWPDDTYWSLDLAIAKEYTEEEKVNATLTWAEYKNVEWIEKR